MLTAVAGIAAAADLTPDILVPDFEGARVISGMSNNGKYGVGSINPDEDGFSYTLGAVIYDLTGSKPVATDLTLKHSAAGAWDVTDDGKLVVGTVDQLPAFCRNTGGVWKWETLPVPRKSADIIVEDYFTGEETVITHTLNGGIVRAVTPDGKYAVGVAFCNEYELYEEAVMWDLTTKQVIEVNSPRTGRDGIDYFQTRYMQISDDGRYLLAWNAFSYRGSIVFVYDRQKNEAIYIDVEEGPDGTFVPRKEGYLGIELDGLSKSLTSDGRYVAGGILHDDTTYIFTFDVPNRQLKIFDDGIHDDVTGWSVTKDGIPLGATPAVTPYADAMVCYDDFLFPMSLVYEDVYGLGMEQKYNIDNTGKPTLISDDGRTIVFVNSQNTTYAVRLKEDLKDALSRVNLMSGWSVSPREGTQMAAFSKATFTFENPVECDPARYAQVKLLDSKGTLVATPLANGGLQAEGNRLSVTFRARQLEAGETYTLTLPEGICWIKGRPTNINTAIEVKYAGRANVPVAVKEINPPAGETMASLDLSDNPVVVEFDVPVMINMTGDDRPIARLYVDGSDEPVASLYLDVDLNTQKLVIYPASTVFLYKGSEYLLKVPQGAVCDLSSLGASEAFEIKYIGSYVPQLGDEQYLFRSTGDDFSNLLFFDGDKGSPVKEYADMGFTADTTPWWVVMDEEISDMAFASHSCYTDGRASDDWLVIRQLRIPDNVDSYLSFQSQSYRKGKEDRLKVYVYENNTSLNQLTAATVKKIKEQGVLVYDEIQSPGNSEELLQGDWTDNIVPLNDFKGKNIYICFLNDNRQQSMVMIDNIEVVKEVKAFLTMTSHTNVVSQPSLTLKGIVTVASELAEYSNITMTLKDGAGNEVSSLSAEFDTPLAAGGTFSFEFPDPLPLKDGSENAYTIEYTLDDDLMDYSGIVRNLAFQTNKRVVVEEYTGKDCQYCPLGILAMENLEERYGDKVIPLVLHAYNGDPKGLNITDYAQTVFFGNGSAPNGRINRRPQLTAPMYSDESKKYHFTAAEVAGAEPVWLDIVNEELEEPALLDITLEPKVSDKPNYVSYTATVTSALNLKGQNVRVLGMLMEDGLLDRQVNGLHAIADENLGQFGKGGKFGMASFYYTFNNVARGFWGQSTNGTGSLIPSTLEVGKDYIVDIDYPIPAIVEKPENLKMAVILIDESTGRVINAAVEQADITGVEDIIADEAQSSIEIRRSGSEIRLDGAGEINVAVYTLDGRVLAMRSGRDSVAVALDSFKGIVIVRAQGAGAATVRKLLM